MGFVLARAALLAAFAGILWMLGSTLDRLRGGCLPLPGPRWVGRLLLGVLAVTALLFVLAASGTLSRGSVFGLAAFVVAGWGLSWGFSRPAASGVVGLPPDRAPWGAFARAAAAGIALLFAGLFLEALNPFPAWDAQVYHLTLPRIWLAAGGFERVPFNVYSNWPSNLQLLFAAATAIGDPLVATLLHWGAALLLVVLLWHGVESGAEAPRGASGLAGAVAALLLLANDVVLFEARAAYVDLAAALALLVAYLLAEEGLERAGDRRRFLAAGLALGYLAGLKPTGALGAIAVGAVVVAAELRRAGSWPARGGRAARTLGWLALPALALLLPWLVRSALQTGNPFYPLFWERFGGPEWSAELGQRLAAWQRAIGMGRQPLDYLLLPWRVVTEGDLGYAHFDGRLGPLWLALVPLALLFGRCARVGRPLAVAAFGFVLWAASAQQVRFLLPALALAALAAGRAVSELLGTRDEVTRRRLAATLLGLAALAALVPPAWRELASTPTLVRRYLADGERVREMAVPPIFRALDELAPPAARVALLNTNQTYFCPRVCLADSFFEASQLAAALSPAADAKAARERFAALGVSHLLVDARPRGIDWPAGVIEMLADPQLAEPLWASPDGRFRLLALR